MSFWDWFGKDQRKARVEATFMLGLLARVEAQVPPLQADLDFARNALDAAADQSVEAMTLVNKLRKTVRERT